MGIMTLYPGKVVGGLFMAVFQHYPRRAANANFLPPSSRQNIARSHPLYASEDNSPLYFRQVRKLPLRRTAPLKKDT